MKREFFAIVTILLSSCATSAVITNALHPSDLNSNPGRYDGSEVTVYGYMVNNGHNQVLLDDEKAYGTQRNDQCVSLLIPNQMNLNWIDNDYVVVRARFLKQLPPNSIHFGACGDTHLELLEVPRVVRAK